jgi:nonribosomal peptide synthetase MxcG
VPPGDGPIPEVFFPVHRGLRDGYQRSKWHAEVLCERAGERGLPVAVYRLGRLTGARPAPAPA